ncbi:MAG: hypothetical protein KTR31_06645 [Myxococcales bacterium]|nr:hypothetical protein [Myxococcales bacterium]
MVLVRRMLVPLLVVWMSGCNASELRDGDVVQGARVDLAGKRFGQWNLGGATSEGSIVEDVLALMRGHRDFFDPHTSDPARFVRPHDGTGTDTLLPAPARPYDLSAVGLQEMGPLVAEIASFGQRSSGDRTVEMTLTAGRPMPLGWAPSARNGEVVSEHVWTITTTHDGVQVGDPEVFYLYWFRAPTTPGGVVNTGLQSQLGILSRQRGDYLTSVRGTHTPPGRESSALDPRGRRPAYLLTVDEDSNGLVDYILGTFHASAGEHADSDVHHLLPQVADELYEHRAYLGFDRDDKADFLRGLPPFVLFVDADQSLLRDSQFGRVGLQLGAYEERSRQGAARGIVADLCNPGADATRPSSGSQQDWAFFVDPGTDFLARTVALDPSVPVSAHRPVIHLPQALTQQAVDDQQRLREAFDGDASRPGIQAPDVVNEAHCDAEHSDSTYASFADGQVGLGLDPLESPAAQVAALCGFAVRRQGLSRLDRSWAAGACVFEAGISSPEWFRDPQLSEASTRTQRLNRVDCAPASTVDDRHQGHRSLLQQDLLAATSVDASVLQSHGLQRLALQDGRGFVWTDPTGERAFELWERFEDAGVALVSVQVPSHRVAEIPSFPGLFVDLWFTVDAGRIDDWSDEIGAPLPTWWIRAQVAMAQGVLDDATNRLPFVEATQVSDWDDVGVASKAIDGNRDADWRNGSVTHTGTNQDAWWQGALERPSRIETLTVYNRTDCCSDRIDGTWVFLFDRDITAGPYQPVDWLDALGASTSAWTLEGDGPSFTFTDVDAVAQYVMLYNQSRYLHFAEMEVFGAPQ